MRTDPETILAMDYGLRRIGVAVGQQVTSSASPLGVLRNTDDGPDWQTLRDIIREWNPSRIVVGLPVHADGSDSAMTARVAGFVKALDRYGLPVDTVDERYTSQEAAELLKDERVLGVRGRITREMIDSAAAVLIAERWFREGAGEA